MIYLEILFIFKIISLYFFFCYFISKLIQKNIFPNEKKKKIIYCIICKYFHFIIKKKLLIFFIKIITFKLI